MEDDMALTDKEISALYFEALELLTGGQDAEV